MGYKKKKLSAIFDTTGYSLLQVYYGGDCMVTPYNIGYLMMQILLIGRRKID